MGSIFRSASTNSVQSDYCPISNFEMCNALSHFCVAEYTNRRKQPLNPEHFVFIGML